MRSGELLKSAGDQKTFDSFEENRHSPVPQLMRIILILLAVLLGGVISVSARETGKPRHVVVIVWDGMRPDFVSEQNTPALWDLAQRGVTFENHHAVYLSSTEVNGAAIATGDYPGDDGIVANKEFRPEIDAEKFIHTESLAAVRKGDAASGGRYLRAPTLAEILQRAGRKTAVAGAKGVALLQDRFERGTAAQGTILFAGETLPENALDQITNLYGAFPKTNRNDWITGAVIDPLWKDGVPDFSLIWMNEPDLTQHFTGPGSKASLAAIKNADENLAKILRELEAKGARDTTDVLLVSDHGFSTVLSLVDLADSLKKAGFNAVREFKTPPARGDILAVSNGGSTLLYVAGRDERVIRDVVNFLQGWSYTGVILTRQPIEGAFTFEQARVDAPTAPDIIVSLRWNSDKNDAGTPGMVVSDISDYGPGQGMHVTLSRFDMHNTLIAAGPDFRSGVMNHLPSGNVDIAPTVLWILGVKPPRLMDGRVLTEALTIKGPKITSFEPGRWDATRTNEKSVWHQYLNFTDVNGVIYFDEGNGYQTAR